MLPDPGVKAHAQVRRIDFDMLYSGAMLVDCRTPAHDAISGRIMRAKSREVLASSSIRRRWGGHTGIGELSPAVYQAGGMNSSNVKSRDIASSAASGQRAKRICCQP